MYPAAKRRFAPFLALLLARFARPAKNRLPNHRFAVFAPLRMTRCGFVGVKILFFFDFEFKQNKQTRHIATQTLYMSS